MNQTVLLGSICTKVTSGGTPSTKHEEYYNGDIPWLRTQEVNFGNIYSTEKTITEAGLKNSSAKLIPENSVIIAMYGATAGKSAINKIPLTTNQACCNLVIDHNKADYRYVYYYLLKNYEKLANSAVGAAQQNLGAKQIASIPIDLPDLVTQNKIADILGAIDEKIELNRKMNETLEQMGQALFRHYFITNPEAEKWGTSSIGGYYDVLLGGTPSRAKNEYWENGTIGWINSGKINEFRITEPSELITEEALNKSAAKLLPVGTTVIAITGATLGQISRLEREFAANQSVIGMVPKGEMSNDFIYHWISYNIAELIGHQTGGAQQHINRNNVVNFELPTPDDATLKVFQEKIEPISSKISNNCFENQTLTTLRDTLLPRLISGKIKV